MHCRSEFIEIPAVIAGACKVLQYALAYSIYCKTVRRTLCATYPYAFIAILGQAGSIISAPAGTIS